MILLDASCMMVSKRARGVLLTVLLRKRTVIITTYEGMPAPFEKVST